MSAYFQTSRASSSEPGPSIPATLTDLSARGPNRQSPKRADHRAMVAAFFPPIHRIGLYSKTEVSQELLTFVAAIGSRLSNWG